MLLAILVVAGCNDKKVNTPVMEIMEDSMIVDTTVYGRCGDGTAMHTLELVTDKGDTVVYTLEGLDTCASVQGGLFVGDRIAVIGERVEGLNEEMFAKKVINLTSLQGVWTSLDKKFEILPMTPEEAVMQMNLLSHEFYLFRNAENGAINVVYKRKDFEYGIIEPTE